jgi:hypothetical protein
MDNVVLFCLVETINSSGGALGIGFLKRLLLLTALTSNLIICLDIPLQCWLPKPDGMSE